MIRQVTVGCRQVWHTRSIIPKLLAVFTGTSVPSVGWRSWDLKWAIPPKLSENNRTKILWEFPIQTDKMVVNDQPDIVVDTKQETVVVV